MVGLVLQGGGARGSYQIGAYYAFLKRHFKFDGICGTSIGAFNGALIVSGKEKELMEFWKNVQIGDVLGFDQEYVNKKINHEFDFDYIKLGFKTLVNVIKSRGVRIEGLEEILNHYLDDDAFINSKMDFGLCTIRVKDLKPLYIFKLYFG